jgi:hypothetical protein
VHLEYPQGDFWLRDIRPTIDAMAMLGDLEAQDAMNALDYVRRWVDLGNGTAYDRVTGLTWEQKTDDGGIHDKDNNYTWGTFDGNADGTAFTTFLATLNGGVTGVGDCRSEDGITQSGGFAGHCDWRLPTVAELQTILLEPLPCSTTPCIDQSVFGPVNASFSFGRYWSSNGLNAMYPHVILIVPLGDGGALTSALQYLVGFKARAVRGGS